MERESIIFYKSWADATLHLQPQERGEILTAIIDYAVYGRKPKELCAVAQAMFTVVKPLIDANNRRFVSGKKGGAPLGNQNAKKTTENNQKQPVVDFLANNQNNQKQPNDKCIMLNDKCNNELSNDNYLSIVNNASSFASQNDPQGDPKKETIVHQALDVVAYYNSEKKRLGARLCECNTKRMTAQRLNAICARIAEYDVESVRTVVDKAMASDFLNFGANNAPVGIDWIMRPNNFPKVLEGNYDNKERTPRNGNNKSMSDDRYIGMIHTEGENDPSVWEREKEKAKQYKR